MSTSTLIYLRPGDRIEAHDGPGAPYLTVTPDDYRSQVVVFLGDPLAPDELAAARRQLDQLEAAVSRARYLIAHHTEGPEPGPDDPTDEPTDDPTAEYPALEARGATMPDDAPGPAACPFGLADCQGDHNEAQDCRPIAPDQRAQALDARREAILDGARLWTETPETEAELRAAWGDR